MKKPHRVKFLPHAGRRVRKLEMDVEELLHPRLLAVARRFKYLSFNQLQLKAFSVLSRGVSAVISAPTGYGKTEASLFPIFSSLLREGCDDGRISALYITPLRALNRDIFIRMSELAAEIGVRLEVRHGDTPYSARKRIAEDPPHILITTPETFQLLLVNEKMRKALQHVRWVVVDELHELIPSKRGLQLTIALERLEQLSAHNIQRIGLSATLKNPLAAGYLLTGGRYFELVEVKEGRQYEVEVTYAGSYSDVEERTEHLLKIVAMHRSVIVFVNTRDTAEALGSRLKQYLGDAVAVHHGSLSKEQRIEAERTLKMGKLRCLIATSSLELGIDVGHVDYVVQYMSSRQVNRLVQRVGRSSHFIGGVAKGAIIAPDVDELSEAIVIARRAERGDLEEIEYEELAYDVLAHQLVGLVIERGEVDLHEAQRLITRALPYRNLTLNELRNLADFLSSIKLLRLEGDKLRRGPRSLTYYYESASTIPDVETLDVIDIASRRKIGVLDGDFAASYLAEGSRFVLGGRVWEVVKVALDEGRLFAKSSEDSEAVIPTWVGEDLPVPYKVAREVGALWRRLLAEPLEKLAAEYNVEVNLLGTIREYLEKQKASTGEVPTDKMIVLEYGGRIAVFHACLGTRANALLALLLSFYLAKVKGVSSKFIFDAYRIALMLSRDVDPGELAEVFLNLKEELLPHVKEAIRGSGAYLWKLLHVCQRIGVLRKGSRLKVPPRRLAELLAGTVVEVEAVKELLSTRFDVETLERLADNLKSGRVKVHVARVRELSPMAKSMFEKPFKAGLLVRGLEQIVALDYVKKRLEKTRLLLVCLHCVEWSSEVSVEDAPDEIRCPKCGSKIVAVFNHWESDAIQVLRKWRRGVKLARGEEDIVRSAQKSAILTMSYGKKALLCLAGRGVGPTVAARILSHGISEEELIREVVRAEAEYLRTREYWHERRTTSATRRNKV